MQFLGLKQSTRIQEFYVENRVITSTDTKMYYMGTYIKLLTVSNKRSGKENITNISYFISWIETGTNTWKSEQT